MLCSVKVSVKTVPGQQGSLYLVPGILAHTKRVSVHQWPRDCESKRFNKIYFYSPDSPNDLVMAVLYVRL